MNGINLHFVNITLQSTLFLSNFNLTGKKKAHYALRYAYNNSLPSSYQAVYNETLDPQMTESLLVRNSLRSWILAYKQWQTQGRGPAPPLYF